jgi:tetratricopeptide (TPR) repeat protein
MACLAVAALCACRENAAAARDRYLQSGDRYVGAGRFREAVLEYRNAARRDPRSSVAEKKLGDSYIALNEPQKAFDAYQRAVTIDSANTDAHLRLGSLLLLSEEFDRAASHARDVLARSPRHVEAHILLANALLGKGDIVDALETTEQAIALNPAAAQPYSVRGELEWRRGDRAAAEASFRKAVDIDGASVRARLSLGDYYWVTRQFDDAEREFRAAVDAAPDDVLAKRTLADFYMMTGRPHAAEPLWKAIAEGATNLEGQLGLVDFYAWSGRQREALATVEPLTKAGDARALTRLAALLYDTGEPTRATEIVDGLLARESTDVRALLLKVQMHLREHDAAAAIPVAERAFALEARSWVAANLLGGTYAAAGRFKDAARAFGDAARLNPSSVSLRLSVAESHAAAGDADEALTVLTRAFPDDRARVAATANNVAWRAAHNGGSLDAALTLARFATGRLASQPEPFDTLGVILLARGDVTGAVAAFEKSVSLAPKNAAYTARLADARSRMSVAAQAR